jgi:TrmH family RNA methyltransferase
MKTNAQRHLRQPERDSLAPSQSPRQRHPSPFPQHAPTITQYQHPILQRIHRLRRREVRDQTGLYYVEGLRFVLQALQHHATIEALVTCPPLLINAFARRLVRQQHHLGVPILEVTSHVMHQLSLVDDAQGIGAVVRQHWTPLAQITPRDELCWIALQVVRSAGNLGTILRTSDAVGGAGIILLGNAVDPYDPASVRATMGALYAQRLVRTTLEEFARWRAHHHCLLVGTSPNAPTDYRAVAYRPPTILLMGEERQGLPADLQLRCDHLVRIPMVGGSDSLNLGVATGVMLYELFNQRRAPT